MEFHQLNRIERIPTLFIGILILFFSCVNPETEENDPKETNYIRALDKDNINTLDDLIFTKINASPYRIKVAMPEIKKPDQNQYRLLKPREYLSSNIQRSREIKAPEKLTYEWKRQTLSFPKPVKAGIPDFKDAASLNIKYLDIDQGLNSSYITSIYEGKEENIWMASAGGGVSRYNGEEFYHFNDETGFNTYIVYDILQDKNDWFWFAGRLGLITIYDGVAYRELHIEGLEYLTVFDLLKDQFDNIWITTENHGVLKYDGKELFQYSTTQGLSTNHILSLEEDSRGRIWIGTFDGGINIIGENEIILMNSATGVPISKVWDLHRDHSGNIWMATENEGVFKSARDKIFNYTVDSGLPTNYYVSVYEDSQYRIWLASYGKGALILGEDYYSQITTKEGLSLDYLWDITEDSFGNIWFGTDGGGISLYCRQKFKNIRDTNGLPNSFVFSTVEAENGDLWFGTFGGGIVRFDGSDYESFSIEQGLPSKFINDLLIDSNNDLWIGTQNNGIIRFDGSFFYHYNKTNGLVNDDVKTIEEFGSDSIWIGTNAGLQFIHSGELYTIETEITSLRVRSLENEKNQKLYVGTENEGLLIYNKDEFKQITIESGLPTDDINSLHIDQSDAKWLGTVGKGLVRMQNDTIEIIDKSRGLSHNSVWMIVEDHKGKIWAGTERGLNEVIKENNKYNIRVYGKQDGLVSEGFFLNSGFLDSSNRLWMGSDRSLIMLDPARDINEPAETSPKIQFTGVRIDQEFFDFRDEKVMEKFNYDSIKDFTNVPIGLKLNHKQDHVTFHFNAVEWSSAHKILYSFRLVGLNDEWSKPERESKADYRNLPSGEFTFMVRAKMIDGDWSTPVSFTFEVTPPWWNTWWAWVIYSLLFVAGIILYVRVRIHNLRKSKKKLQEEVDKATKELELSNAELTAINDELLIQRKELESAFTDLRKTQQQLIASEKMASLGILSSGIAHEINNPLNYIQGGIYVITNYFRENPSEYTQEMKDLINAMELGVKRANKIVRSLSLFSKNSEKKNEVCDIHEMLDDCLVILSNQVKHRIEIEKLFASDDLFVKGNNANLYQAFLHILTNAEQAIEEQGYIRVKTYRKGKLIHIMISDTGSGISEENLSRISDPFYTTKAPNQGTGLGLTITHTTIEDHGGSIEFSSELGKGTDVLVKLPAYRPDYTK